MPKEYLTTLERFFVLLRRRGLMLSPKDVDLALSWQEAGLSIEVVCRGLAKGAEVLRQRNGEDQPIPDSLSYYTVFVEQILAEQRDISPSQLGLSDETDATLTASEDVVIDLRWIEQLEGDHRLKRAYLAAREAIEALGEGVDEEYALSIGDTAAVDALLELLSSDERTALDVAVTERLRKEASSLGRRALAMRRRALLEDEMTSQLGLVRLGDRHA
ncbi:MAG: hypothetical protein ACI9OJ_000765 [Myxococcota bacterium]|jgi:hypothetical protein